jgi:hypothetical protein
VQRAIWNFLDKRLNPQKPKERRIELVVQTAQMISPSLVI